MCMRGLYTFRYGEHFGFSVSHTTRQPRPGRKKTLNGCYLDNIYNYHDHDNTIINFFIIIISLATFITIFNILIIII